MTNNLKEEIENTLTVLTSADRENELRWRRDEIDTAELMELRESTKREATESILALINQKEKEGVIKELEEIRREVNYRLSNDLQIAELKRDQYATVVEVEEKVIEDRIKQLKEEGEQV